MLGTYLVVMTTLGAIRGIHTRLFEAGETVTFDDPDLAAVGIADGWLTPIDALPEDIEIDTEPKGQFRVIKPRDLPGFEKGWASDLPQEGAIIDWPLSEAVELITSGILEAVETEAVAPETVETEAVESEAVEPEAEAVAPETVETEAVESEAVETEAEAVAPETVETEAVESEAVEPEAEPVEPEAEPVEPAKKTRKAKAK